MATGSAASGIVCPEFTRSLSYSALGGPGSDGRQPGGIRQGSSPQVPHLANQLPEPIQFGKYSLYERIGRGGMAEVFKGRIQGPAGFERTFVVKRILPHLSDDQSFIKMFVEEAKMSARLNHPNIVHIFELGAVEGEYFISMEYIRGHDLSETMRGIWKTMGPPRPELVAYIGREACRGLAYAHGLTDDNGRPLGMIHRDISPSNVMLSYEGAVKLLDFGIAKALGDTSEATRSGTMKGKYAYMAPEQTDGDQIDHRADIFSCGIVLHEVLTGRRLFKGQNDVQTIERVRRCDVPPPSLQNPAVPPALDAVVLRALARNPHARFQSAADMADALDDVVHDARFQPTHLAQLLHDLFPTDGGPPRRKTAQVSAAHGLVPVGGTVTRGSTGSGVSQRSRTVPPVSLPQTMSGVNPASFDSGAGAPSLAPKSRFPAVALTLVVLAAGAGAAWKFYPRRGNDFRVTSVGDPNRRFYIHVKSTPEGANIYLVEPNREKLLGSTPVTLPIDLSGVSSVKLRLKKDGYDTFEQLVANDDPLSISLTPAGAAPAGDPGASPPPAAPAAPGAPSPSSPTSPSPSPSSASPSSSTSSSSSSRSRRRSKPAAKTDSDEPKGEIIE
jgi:serine/threonine protein kinase